MSQEPSKATRSVLESTFAPEAIPTYARKVEHNLVAKNQGNRTSRQLAIAAMCAHCMGCTVDYMEPGFKEEIRRCTSAGCPLWHFRPYK